MIQMRTMLEVADNSGANASSASRCSGISPALCKRGRHIVGLHQEALPNTR